jgi:hypothetical protein
MIFILRLESGFLALAAVFAVSGVLASAFAVSDFLVSVCFFSTGLVSEAALAVGFAEELEEEEELLLVDVALPTLFSETVLLFVAARCAAMRIPRVFSSAADIIKHKYYI